MAVREVKGKSLEKNINELFNKFYEPSGIACQQNHPQMLHGGEYAKPHGYDFQILYKSTFYAFDAKECHGSRINIKSNLKVHQRKALYDVFMNGGQGFFLVHFIGQGLNRLDIEYIQQEISKGIKSFAYDKSKECSLDIIGFIDEYNRSNKGQDQLSRSSTTLRTFNT